MRNYESIVCVDILVETTDSEIEFLIVVAEAAEIRPPLIIFFVVAVEKIALCGESADPIYILVKLDIDADFSGVAFFFGVINFLKELIKNCGCEIVDGVCLSVGAYARHCR